MLREAIEGLAFNLAVIFTVAYLFALRAKPLRLTSPHHRLITAGIFFGLGLLALSLPFYSQPGVRLDMRPPLLGWAGVVGGPGVALPAAAALAVARYFVGGDGTWAGVLACFLNAAAGLLFFRRRLTWSNLFFFVLTVWAGAMLAAGLIPGRPLYAMPFPPVLFATYGAFTLIFHFLTREFETKVTLEERLYDELRFKESVLEVVDAGVAAFDREGHLTLCNGAARQLLAPVGDPGGRHAGDLFATSPALVQRVLRRERFSHELYSLSREGGETHLAVTGLPTDKGMILAFSNVSQVIATEREEARRRRLTMLGELAAMAAHEIKNPLTAIKGFAQLLTNRAARDEGTRRYAEVIVSEVEAIDRVCTDFLSLARTRPAHLGQVALAPLLAEVAEEMALRFPRAQVSVRMHLETAALFTDRQTLKQVLANLYANAYDAMGGRGTLQVTAARRGPDLLLEVQDSGPGIASDVLPGLFQAFTTTKAEGSGLGLAVCERLVSGLGGEITAASPPEGGALFRLRLPQEPVSVTSQTTPA